MDWLVIPTAPSTLEVAVAAAESMAPLLAIAALWVAGMEWLASAAAHTTLGGVATVTLVPSINVVTAAATSSVECAGDMASHSTHQDSSSVWHEDNPIYGSACQRYAVRTYHRKIIRQKL